MARLEYKLNWLGDEVQVEKQARGMNKKSHKDTSEGNIHAI